jgi:DNA-binding HxlR family transcriptional regulator
MLPQVYYYAIMNSASKRATRKTDGRSANPGKTAAPTGCRVAELFAVLGQPHMLDLLHAFQTANGVPLRLTILQRQLQLSPKTLAHRLKVLVEAGFVSRRAFGEIPPRVEYEPTSKTSELNEIFEVLERWSARNNLQTPRSVAVVGAPPR